MHIQPRAPLHHHIHLLAPLFPAPASPTDTGRLGAWQTKSLRFALAAAVASASGTPRHTEGRARRHQAASTSNRHGTRNSHPPPVGAPAQTNTEGGLHPV